MTAFDEKIHHSLRVVVCNGDVYRLFFCRDRDPDKAHSVADSPADAVRDHRNARTFVNRGFCKC